MTVSTDGIKFGRDLESKKRQFRIKLRENVLGLTEELVIVVDVQWCCYLGSLVEHVEYCTL